MTRNAQTFEDVKKSNKLNDRVEEMKRQTRLDDEKQRERTRKIMEEEQWMRPPGSTPPATGEDDFDAAVGRHARAAAQDVLEETSEEERQERLRLRAEEAQRGALRKQYSHSQSHKPA
jgi:hypothetical protein